MMGNNTVRLTCKQATQIQYSLDTTAPELADVWRAGVFGPVVRNANGETFDIVPAPPPLKAHSLKTQTYARIEAVVGGSSGASYKVNCEGWYFRAGDCDEAAEFFQMLARELRERE